MNCKIFVNVLLSILTCLVAWCVASSNSKHRKIGYVIGLCNQPLWVYVGWESGNYGVLVTVLIYTYAWMKGIVNHYGSLEKYKKYFP